MDVIVESAHANELVGSTLSGCPNLLLNSLHFWIADEWTGQTFIPEEDSYNYNIADAIGGTGSYTYQWWYSTNGEDFTLTYTGQSYTRSIQEDDPDFWLKVKVTSGSGSLATTGKKVELCWNHDNGENCDARPLNLTG